MTATRTRGRLAPQTFVIFSAVLVLLASAGALGVVFSAGDGIISGRERAAAEGERDLLVELARTQGQGAVAAWITQRVRFSKGAETYGLFAPSGRRLAGDIPADRPGFHDDRWRYVPVVGADGGAVRAVAARLADGASLVVGRDRSDQLRFARAGVAGLIVAVGIVATAALAAGLLLNALILQRVDAIAGTAERIARGDLSARAPFADRRDPFGRVGASLNAMLARLEELMTGMRTVTDSLAHDLRSPLTRMKGALDRALRVDIGEAERLDAIEAAGVEADRTLATLSALLDIARAETGLSREMMRPVDLAALMADTVEVFAPVLEDAGQALRPELPNRPVWAPGHAPLLRQAVGNLLYNASQHAGPGAVVSAAVEEIAGVVRLVVADTGPGIAPEQRGRVQERFVRVDAARTGAGAGLGLAIVAACAKLHGGTLRLDDNSPGLRAILEIAAP